MTSGQFRIADNFSFLKEHCSIYLGQQKGFMHSHLFRGRIFKLVILLIFSTHSTALTCRADYVVEKTVWEFFPANSGPDHPFTPLTQALDGNFYGTTVEGGSSGNGTIYRLTPGGNLSVLVSFDGVSGARPRSGLLQTSNGVFYGTTAGSSLQSRFGSFFKMTTNGVMSPLFYFGGTNGESPRGPLAQGSDGLYGTTQLGGAFGLGTIFKITTNGTFSLLHSFNGTNDGCYPTTGLVTTGNGNFFGTTSYGGNGLSEFSGNGTVFRFRTNGTFTTLVNLDATPESGYKSGLTVGSSGLLYGVAGKELFQMTTNGTFTVLGRFDGTNGNRSAGGLTEGRDGHFYGVTPSHTGPDPAFGTIFQLKTNGELKTIFYFNGTNARNPNGTMTLARDGSLFVTVADEQRNMTLNGNRGAIFRLVEPPNLTIARVGGNLKLTFKTFTNGVYRLEKKELLDSEGWTPISPNIVATGNSISFTNSPGDADQEFYRATLLP